MKKFFVLYILTSLCLSFSGQDYWEHVHTNDTNTIWSIEIANDGTIYYGSSSGLYISYDDGMSWDFKYLGKYSYMYDIEFDIDSNLICIANKKIYKYKAFEDKWEFLFQPEESQQFRSILVDSTTIFAGSDIRVFRYSNGLWDEMGFNGANVGLTDIIKDTSGRLFIGATNYTGGGGVTESLDNGETWTLIGLQDSYIQDLEIDSQNRLYAASIGHNQFGIGGMYRYNRETETWDTLRLYHRVQSILFNEEDSLYIGQYTTGGPPAGAFISPDYGDTWYDMSSGFPEDDFNKNVMHLKLGPQNHLFSIIQNANSIYKSDSTTIVGLKDHIGSDKLTIQLFPNPFHSHIILVFNRKAKKLCNISIYNIKGELILHKDNVPINDVEVKYRLKVQLPNGIYFFNVTFDNFCKTIKIIKY